MRPALVSGDMGLLDALIVAAYANRVAGSYARPTPATQVTGIVRHISDALMDVMRNKEERLEEAKRVR